MRYWHLTWYSLGLRSNKGTLRSPSWFFTIFSSFITATKPCEIQDFNNVGDRSFAAAALQLRNSLPYAIRSSPSVASFKKTLKTFLFQKAFLWFYVLFNLVFSRFYAVFYDLSSLGNFYSFSVDIIVLTLFGRFMHFMHVYFMQS